VSERIFKTKKNVQGAHEAIRPTSIERTPESIKEFLNPDQYKLYELIYKRFLASQMAPMRYRLTSVYIEADQYQFLASGTSIIFEGFAIVYNKSEEEKDKNLPKLEKDEILNLIRLIPSQHFTKPPPRFSEGTLVKALEQDGIGRPSTYAPIIQTLTSRYYVMRQKGYFIPTELGFKVGDLLVEYFPKIMDIKFTAQMEEELDEIEEGKCDRLKVLNDFYFPFKSSLDFAQKNIKKEIILSDEICDKCGEPMVIKWGRRGKFLSCSTFPKCRNSKPITTGIPCLQEGCNGELIERRWKRGVFYGCSNFPKCRFTAKNLPQDEPKDGTALH
jgi:DNA topoisomerase-1